jgi:hypothetical protein
MVRGMDSAPESPEGQSVLAVTLQRGTTQKATKQRNPTRRQEAGANSQNKAMTKGRCNASTAAPIWQPGSDWVSDGELQR